MKEALAGEELGRSRREEREVAPLEVVRLEARNREGTAAEAAGFVGAKEVRFEADRRGRSRERSLALETLAASEKGIADTRLADTRAAVDTGSEEGAVVAVVAVDRGWKEAAVLGSGHTAAVVGTGFGEAAALGVEAGSEAAKAAGTGLGGWVAVLVWEREAKGTAGRTEGKDIATVLPSERGGTT